jgi:hypothetical protein
MRKTRGSNLQPVNCEREVVSTLSCKHYVNLWIAILFVLVQKNFELKFV